MSASRTLKFPNQEFARASKIELIQMVLTLRVENLKIKTESELTITALQEKLAARDAELEKLIKKDINMTANQPSSKQPEFNKKTGQDLKTKNKKRKKTHKGRKGAGNRPKPEPDIVNNNPLDFCPACETDLTNQTVVETVSRIVEDIPPPPEKTIISKEVQERKWVAVGTAIASSPPHRSQRAELLH
jgi:hypothetical protein